MKLTKEEKREMLEDSQSQERMRDFRFLRESRPKLAFEECLAWLTQLQQLPFFRPRPNRFVEYHKNLL